MVSTPGPTSRRRQLPAVPAGPEWHNTAASATPCATLREPPPPFPALSLSTPHGMGSYRADHTAAPPCCSGLWGGGGGLSISIDTSTQLDSVVLYGRSRRPCLARASGCVPLQDCCTLVGVLPTGHLRVAFFVTYRYLWSSRPLTSHFFLRFCADRLLCARALAQASSGRGGGAEVVGGWRAFKTGGCLEQGVGLCPGRCGNVGG